MPNIKINDLHPAGFELFSDSESYMNELGDGEFDSISGGTGSPVISIVTRVTARSSGRCFQLSIKATGYVPTKNTPTLGSVIASIKKISNPFNSI